MSDAEKTVLDRKGEGSALKESQRVMSVSEQVFLRDFKEKGAEMLQKNHLDVWLIGESRSTMNYEFNEKFLEIENAHNEKVKSNEDDQTREYRFWIKDFGDFKYDLEHIFGRLNRVQEIPEMIVIKSEPGEYDGSWTHAPALVQEAVDRCVENLFRYWDENIIAYLGENICCEIASEFDFSKHVIDEDSMIEYGLSNLEMVRRDQQKTYFEKYIFTKDKKYLEEFFSDDALKQLYDFMCTYDEDRAYDYANDFWESISKSNNELDGETQFFVDFRGTIDHEKKRKEFQDELKRKLESGEISQEDAEYEEYDWGGEEVDAATENYLAYRMDMAEFSKTLSFEKIKDKMRAYYVERISKELETYAPEYIREHDILEAEKRLLKPIIVLISENPVQRELIRDAGAEVVLDDISEAEINGLLDLLGKVKSSSASLMPEKLRRIKSEFYKSVEDKFDARSEITAETEKEVEIVTEIFENVGSIKKVLDIACGNGRIDIPLLEKGYEVTGVDANEQFLQSALKKAMEKGLPNAHFKKGDVIDYRGVVEKGGQDAVIYTWHSILEAFGPGNTLHTLGNAWQALRPGGVLVFDQPTRENPHMEDGWYGNDPDEEHHYLSYIMTEEEIRFILKIAGFENVEIKKWTTKPNEEYPDGMHKFTVSARKPEVSEDAKSATKMYRGMIEGDAQYQKTYEQWSKDQLEWADQYQKRKEKEKSA